MHENENVYMYKMYISSSYFYVVSFHMVAIAKEKFRLFLSKTDKHHIYMGVHLCVGGRGGCVCVCGRPLERIIPLYFRPHQRERPHNCHIPSAGSST